MLSGLKERPLFEGKNRIYSTPVDFHWNLLYTVLHSAVFNEKPGRISGISQEERSFVSKILRSIMRRRGPDDDPGKKRRDVNFSLDFLNDPEAGKACEAWRPRPAVGSAAANEGGE
ncbi:unnamed protein product [Victoria cruziana]